MRRWVAICPTRRNPKLGACNRDSDLVSYRHDNLCAARHHRRQRHPCTRNSSTGEVVRRDSDWRGGAHRAERRPVADGQVIPQNRNALMRSRTAPTSPRIISKSRSTSRAEPRLRLATPLDIELAIRQRVEVLARFQEVKIAILLGVQSFDVPTRRALIVHSTAGASSLDRFAVRPAVSVSLSLVSA